MLWPCSVVHMPVGLHCWVRCWRLRQQHIVPRRLGANIQNTKTLLAQRHICICVSCLLRNIKRNA